ncbi:MAG: response regulator transcription factor [Cyclobacteriaceae bacterium]|nr:response regulator transcription factor [Cyclobacteriaceae bacterium]
MEILIIEDEKPAADRLKTLVSVLLPDARIYGHIDSINSAVSWFENHPAPDLIFCDIHLADGQSFEIFERIKVNSPIIFTTAYNQYAIKAFKLNSVDYLLKPLDPAELESAIQKFQRQTLNLSVDIHQLKSLLLSEQSYKERFLIKIGEKIHSLPVSEVSFFFTAEKATFLQNHDGRKYIIDYTLEQLENLLNPSRFYRLNRKYIASFESIEGIFSYSNSRMKVKLNKCDDNDILISREKTASFKAWLDR